MAINLCRRSISSLRRYSVFVNKQPAITNQSRVLFKLLTDTNPCSRAGLAFDKAQEKFIGLRTKNLPPYPDIECIKELDDIESFLPSHYKLVKYGDYEFLESADGYVQVYIHGYHNTKNIDARSGFSVYFGADHPLNVSGEVERRQSLNNAKLYALSKTMQQIPHNLFQKLCICADDYRFIDFINFSLRYMSENAFRSERTGKLNKDFETCIEINKHLRSRQDLQLRMKLVPSDLGVDGMYWANKIAEKVGEEATKTHRRLKASQR